MNNRSINSRTERVREIAASIDALVPPVSDIQDYPDQFPLDFRIQQARKALVLLDEAKTKLQTAIMFMEA